MFVSKSFQQETTQDELRLTTEKFPVYWNLLRELKWKLVHHIRQFVNPWNIKLAFQENKFHLCNLNLDYSAQKAISRLPSPPKLRFPNLHLLNQTSENSNKILHVSEFHVHRLIGYKFSHSNIAQINFDVVHQKLWTERMSNWLYNCFTQNTLGAVPARWMAVLGFIEKLYHYISALKAMHLHCVMKF